LSSGSSGQDQGGSAVSDESAPVAEIPSEAQSAELKGRDVLVSGATGFFGAHLVREVISKDPDVRVLCLMRDGSKTRLRERLAWYFSEEGADKLLQNIEVIRADLSQKGLGLSDDETDALAARIGEIYHCAADVRHYSSDEDNYLKVNVGGTREMIELARKSNARLYHMSTCSVSGSELENATTAEFTEKDLDIGQKWQDNIYVKSKFLAEKAVFEAVESGVDAVIFRLGRLVGREVDGKFQPNPESNMFYLIMKAAESVGALPDVIAGVKWDFMPIDMAAEQVVLLKQSHGRVFHIMNQDPPTLGELFCAASSSHRIVSVESFVETFLEKEPSIDRIYSTLIRMHFLPPYKEPKIKVTCDITADALKKIGYSRKIRSLEVALGDFRKGK
jgi:thioester reductase-like protein